ncbi:MAG: hypothetical protein ACJ79E_04130 [Anaeromyxobacteraceae bacterium]
MADSTDIASTEGAAPLVAGAASRWQLAADRALLLGLSAAGALVAVAYVTTFWALDALPFQDVPNHLARAVILSDFLFDGARRFGAAFTLKLVAAPYLLADLGLASLVHALGPYVAGRLFLIATWASLPVSVAVYLRARRYAAPSIALATLVALYLATDWSFMTGFQAYRLGVALTLLALAAWERFLEDGAPRWGLAYVGCVGLAYLTHLSAVLTIGVATGVTGLLALRSGKARWTHLALGAAPLVVAVLWELAATHGDTGGGLARWDPVHIKLKRTFSMFHRYEYAYEAPLCALFAGVIWLLGRDFRRTWRSAERAVTAGALAVAFLVLFFALPETRGYVSWIDCRALPFVPLFVLFAALAVNEERRRDCRAAAVLALVLVAGNVALLRAHLLPNNEHLREMRDVAARVPAGALFLAIPTHPHDEATNPFLHAGSFATIASGAITPYLFVDGVTRYLHRRGWVRRVPSEFWYQERRGGPFLGWEMTVAGWVYPYVLWEKPYDPSGGPFVETRLIAENGAAALFEVVP